jgi:hypothetical protein
MRRNVDEDGLLVLNEGIDNVRTVLEDLVVHVTLATRETSPVGKNHHGQLLTVVEVTESLSGLEGGIGVPYTTGLLGDHLHRVGVGRVGRGDVLHRAGLDSDDTHGNTTKTGTTNNDGASPTAEGLLEGALIEQTGEEAVDVLLTADEPSDIVRLLGGGK